MKWLNRLKKSIEEFFVGTEISEEDALKQYKREQMKAFRKQEREEKKRRLQEERQKLVFEMVKKALEETKSEETKQGGDTQ